MNKNYNYLFKKDALDLEKKSIEANIKLLDVIYSSDNKCINLDDDFLYSDESLIYNIICGLFESGTNKQFELDKFKLSDIACSHVFDKDSITVITKNNLKIFARRLSGNLKGLSNKKYLNLRKFDGYKHDLENLVHLSSKLSFPNKVVTGYIHEESSKTKKIHSWIEYTGESKTYIIDFKDNLIMNKEGYYFLKHVSLINQVDSKNITFDIALLYEIFGNEISLEEYITVRNELLNDISKNKVLSLNIARQK